MNWIADYIDGHGEEFWQRALKIHGYAELAGEERQSAAELCAMLEQAGFAVEQGLGSQPTAFRAVYGNGGPVIGFLCEYDALPKLNQTEGTCYNGDGTSGHGCGHNLLGVGAAAAAMALREEMEKRGLSGTLVIYGCPAEETLFGKTKMAEEGYFKELDVALAWHPEDHYCCGEVCHKAMDSIRFRLHGRSAHASVCPELGRSALDGAEMMSVGANYLREHVPDDTRMHYTMTELPGPANIVPARAVGKFSLRSFSRTNLELVVERFYDIVKGAALIAGVEYEIHPKSDFYNKIPVLKLNRLLMENAELAGAPRLSPPRERTGSTDFGNVMYEIPGSCIRVAFVPEGTASHSQEFLDAGKSQAARDCVLYGAKSIAGACWDLIGTPGLMEEVKREFAENKKKFK